MPAIYWLAAIIVLLLLIIFLVHKNYVAVHSGAVHGGAGGAADTKSTLVSGGTQLNFAPLNKQRLILADLRCYSSQHTSGKNYVANFTTAWTQIMGINTYIIAVLTPVLSVTLTSKANPYVIDGVNFIKATLPQLMSVNDEMNTINNNLTSMNNNQPFSDGKNIVTIYNKLLAIIGKINTFINSQIAPAKKDYSTSNGGIAFTYKDNGGNPRIYMLSDYFGAIINSADSLSGGMISIITLLTESINGV